VALAADTLNVYGAKSTTPVVVPPPLGEVGLPVPVDPEEFEPPPPHALQTKRPTDNSVSAQ